MEHVENELKSVPSGKEYTIAKRSPKVAEWLSKDPNNLILAQDDLDGFEKLEQSVNDYSLMQSAHDALAVGTASANSAIAKAPWAIMEMAYLPQNIIAEQFGIPQLEAHAPEILRKNSITEYLDRTKEYYAERNKDLQNSVIDRALSGDISGASRSLFASAVSNAPNLALLMASGGAALPIAGVTTAADTMSEFKDEGKLSTTGTATAMTLGSLEAVFEKTGTLKILKDAEIALMKRVGRQSAREIVQNTIKTIGANMFTEGQSEFLTSFTQDMTEYMAGTNPDALKGIAQRAVDAGLVGAAMGGGMVTPGSMAMARMQRQASIETGLLTDFYTSLKDASDNSKVKKRLPEKFQEQIKTLTESGPVQNIYMHVDKFKSFFQEGYEGGVAKAITDLGIEESFNNAEETGGMVSIPTDVYVAKLADTDVYLRAKNDITFDPNKLSANEVKEQQKQTQEALQSIRELGEKFDPSVLENLQVSDGKSVQDQVYNQLVALGMNQKEARLNSVIYRSFDVLAKRSGTTAQELFANYGLKIGRATSQGAIVSFPTSQKLDVRKTYAPAINKLRRGLSVPFQKEVKFDEHGNPLPAEPMTPEEEKLNAMYNEEQRINKFLTDNGIDLNKIESQLKEAKKVLKSLEKKKPSVQTEQEIAITKKKIKELSDEQKRETDQALKMIESELSRQASMPEEQQKEFAQSVTLRKGEEDLSKYGIEPGKKYNTRDVAAALEARQREKYGMIDEKDRSDAAAEKIANWMAEEVLFANSRGGDSGVGWYSTKFQNALDIMSYAFPELANDVNARNTVTALIAITSDGEKVEQNFKSATDIYKQYREDGSFKKIKAQRPNVASNIAKLEKMYAENGIEKTHQMLLEEITIKDLNAQLRAAKEKTVSGYQASVKIPRAAAIFGPKLGAFYANLMGSHGYLTMDRWFSRTFNRYRGILLTAPTKDGLNRFRKLLKKPKLSDEQTIAETVKYAESYKEKNYKKGTVIEKAANTIYKAAFESLEDAPFNSTDRTFMIGAVNKAQQILTDRGLDLSIADIQAALWYYEKQLYGELGAKKTADISYEEATKKILDLVTNPAQISKEATPSTSVVEMQGIHDAPLDKKIEYLKRTNEVLVKDGRDVIADLVGMPQGKTIFGYSAWQGVIGAGEQMFVQAPLIEKDGMVTDEGRKLINTYCAAVGLVLEQDAVVWSLPTYTEDKTQENGFEIETKRPLTESEMRLLYNALHDKFNTWELAPAYTESGARILNFVSGLDNEVFKSNLNKIIEELDASFGGGINVTKNFKSDGDYVSNDWGKDKNAEGYQKYISQEGRSDLYERLADLRSSIKAIQKEFADKYGWDKPVNERTREQISAEQSTRREFNQEGVGRGYQENLRVDTEAQGVSDRGRIPGSDGVLAESVRQDSRNRKSLAGLPATVRVGDEEKSYGFSDTIRTVAARYMAAVKLPYNPPKTYRKVDQARAKKIAAEFEKMVHDPSNPEVKAAYDALASETIAQWKAVKQAGLVVEFMPEGQNPYEGSPRKAIDDIVKNNHLYVFPTAKGFGTDPNFNPEGNPLLQVVEGETISGQPVLVNDLFRIVHDYFGHAKEGVGFRANGEENAWRIHSAMFSPLAQRALTTETRGQNSWVNYGKFGAQNQVAGELETIFADQKIGLLPEWISNEGLEDDQKLLEKDELYQKSKEAKRGRIIFNENGTVNIDLLEKSDKTTFLHESAHFLLEVFGDLAERDTAPADIVDDYNKILKYLGVESRDQIKKEQHEKFAESFEKYLMEGIAPSRSLEKAFWSFKVWMISVYGAITNQYPNVQLNQEIKDVFNRMLATEAEIAESVDRFNANPLFLKPGEIMSEEEAAKYDELHERELRIASDKLRAKALKNMAKENAEKKKAKEKEVREQITKRVEEEQDQIIYSRIKNGVDGEQFVFRISRHLAKSVVPKEIIESMPEGVFHPQGSHPDAVAELLGLEMDGDTLLRTMSDMEPKKDRIERLTEDRMRELYPDPTKDKGFSKDSDAAIHNDAGSERRLFEINTMMKNAPKETIAMLRKLLGRNYNSVEAYKQKAQRIIGAMQIKEIKPAMFKRAEIRYSKESLDAFNSGDWNKAIELRSLSLTNYELYKIAVQVEEEMETAYDRFNGAFRSDSEIAKNRDVDIVNAARSLLSKVGFQRTKGKPDDYLEKLSKYGDKDQVATMKALSEAAGVEANDLGDVSYSQFLSIKNAFDAIWELSKNEQQVTVNGKKMSKFEAIEDLGKQLLQVRNDKAMEEYSKKPGFWDNLGTKILSFRAATKRVESWVDYMDMGNINGPFRTLIWDPVQGGVTEYKLAKAQYLAKAESIVKKHTKGFSQEPIKTNLSGVPGKRALKHSWENKAHLLGAMLHTGNESNLKKLLVGNQWGTIDENGNLDSSAWDAEILRYQREGILTKEDYEFLQSYWDLMEELKPIAQKAHKEMYGFYFSEITSKPITTPWGIFKGGYAPAITDKDVVSNNAQDKKLIEEGQNSSMFPPMVNGFTKDRNENYKEPLSMNLNLVVSHMDKVLRFSYITPRVRDVAKLVLDHNFRKRLDGYNKFIVSDILVPWMQRATTQSSVTHSTNALLDSLAQKARLYSGTKIMFLNVVNALQQPTGLIIAAAKVKPKYLMKALWDNIRTPKELSQMIIEKSDFMMTRRSKQINDAAHGIQKTLINPSRFEQTQQFFIDNAYVLQELMQNQVDAVVWNGAYNEAVDNGKTEEDAIRLADAAVRQTQGSQDAISVSSIETGSPLYRLFTMFGGFTNMLLNLYGTESAKVLQSNYGLNKKAKELFFIYMVTIGVQAALTKYLLQIASGAGLDADDDDEYIDDFLANFFGGSLETSVAMVPFFGQVANLYINQFNKNMMDDRLMPSPALKTVEDSAKLANDIAKFIETGTVKKQMVTDAASFISLFTGIPVEPVARPVKYLMDVESGKAQPESAADFTRGLITGRSPQK